MIHFTLEIAGAIILLLRTKCSYVRTKKISSCSKQLDKYTLECALKFKNHECSTDCFILKNGLCPIGITEDSLRMDQIRRLLPKDN